jgi:ADP-heptose:LPS heptosyltransferase
MRYVELVKAIGGIGDLLMLTPLPRLFHEDGRRVLVDCFLPALFKTNPYVVQDTFVNIGDEDEVKQINFKDAYESRPHLHYWDALLEVAGLPSCPPQRPEIFLTEEEMEKARRMVANTPRPLIVVAPATGMLWQGKQLPLFTWSKVVEMLRRDGASVVGLGPWLQGCVYKNYLAATPRSLAAFISQTDFFIGHESAPLHLAQAFKIPGLCILGSTDSRRFSLIGDEIKPVWNKALDCIGCRHRREPPTKEEVCERGDFECMFGISAEEVFEEYKRWS